MTFLRGSCIKKIFTVIFLKYLCCVLGLSLSCQTLELRDPVLLLSDIPIGFFCSIPYGCRTVKCSITMAPGALHHFKTFCKTHHNFSCQKTKISKGMGWSSFDRKMSGKYWKDKVSEDWHQWEAPSGGVLSVRTTLGHLEEGFRQLQRQVRARDNKDPTLTDVIII